MGFSIEDRAEAVSDAEDGAGTPKPGLLEFDVDFTVHACVAALDASGRDLSELGSFEDDFPSLPGRNVRSILPFFSGEGVRDFLSAGGPGESVDALCVCVKLYPRVEPVPELFRGVMAGRNGSGGGRERSV